MKKLITAIITMTTLASGCSEGVNPLLQEFDTPHGTPPFRKIKTEHYMPAFEEGVRQSREEVAAISGNPDAPTFENTVEALERQGALLDRVATTFFPLLSSQASDQINDIANRVQPLLTELGNDITLDPALFERVSAVYHARRDDPALDAEQRMLLEKMYRDFTRSGAALSDEDKVRYREITTELASLGLRFGQNVLAATNAYSLNIPPAEESRVANLPAFLRESLAAEAAERGEQGWTITLHAPSYAPFIMYSDDSETKKALWMAYNTLCYDNGEKGNAEIVGRITELRLELARLLGYETYADFSLEESMAKSRDTVYGFLDELLDSTRGWADADYAEIERYADSLSGETKELTAWDFTYFSERYKEQHYNFRDEETKPYFKLENAERGTFMLAEKLFGLTFKETKEIDVYHPDVRTFEVYDADGRFLSVLYVDYFPRKEKRGGAWMTNFREMYTTEQGTEVRPLVTLCYNFTKPTRNKPSLLTFDEVETMLHEFGHALHGMMAEGRYGSMTGTNVYRDFVELPSQLLENWATEKEFLDLWAVHYQSGEKMPEELIHKVERSKNFLAAFRNLRQLTFGYDDMAWHTITSPVTEDPALFETRAVGKAEVIPHTAGTCLSTSFNHIFSGGYAAGYYSYKWSEVLEADAFSLFKERGIFDRATGESLRRNILSRGGSEHPMTLYVRFRGHEPETRALIERIGEGHR